MRFLILLLFCLSASAQSWTTYDANRCVPFTDGIHSRCGVYDWWVQSTGEPSVLLPEGTREYGSLSLNLPVCWSLETNCSAIKVEVIDTPGVHSDTCIALIRKCAPGVQCSLRQVNRFYPQDIAIAFSNAVVAGANIICLSAQIVNQADPPFDYGLSNMIAQAQTINGGVILSCSVPNANQCLCVTPDRPSSWVMKVWNVMPATALYTDGTRITNPGAAWGFRVLGWPGRNIIRTDGTYSSGTSYAAAIQAGVCALMLAQVNNSIGFPDGLVVAQALRDFATGSFVANPSDAMLHWRSDWFTYQWLPLPEP